MLLSRVDLAAPILLGVLGPFRLVDGFSASPKHLLRIQENCSHIMMHRAFHDTKMSFKFVCACTLLLFAVAC